MWLGKFSDSPTNFRAQIGLAVRQSRASASGGLARPAGTCCLLHASRRASRSSVDGNTLREKFTAPNRKKMERQRRSGVAISWSFITKSTRSYNRNSDVVQRHLTKPQMIKFSSTKASCASFSFYPSSPPLRRPLAKLPCSSY